MEVESSGQPIEYTEAEAYIPPYEATPPPAEPAVVADMQRVVRSAHAIVPEEATESPTPTRQHTGRLFNLHSIGPPTRPRS